MLRYWKKNGKKELRIVVRKDCYRFDESYLYLPKGLKVRYKGEVKWRGEQRRLEILYDEVDTVGLYERKVRGPSKNRRQAPLHRSRRQVLSSCLV